MINLLKSKFPWPDTKPDLPFKPDGWFPSCNRELLQEYFKNNSPKVIVELGSWMGLSSRWILDNTPDETILICIDHWKGSPENKNDPDLPLLYDYFISNCWAYRSRLIPIRTNTKDGLNTLISAKVAPDIVYVDAGHDYESALSDLSICSKFNCPMIGDDFNPNSWAGVVRAVWESSVEVQKDLLVHGSAWRIG